MNWQPKETMPKSGEFLVTLRMYGTRTGKFIRWNTYVIRIDENGEIEEDMGWLIGDYELWCPIPELPDPTTLEG